MSRNAGMREPGLSEDESRMNRATASCVIAARLVLTVRFRTPIWPVLLHPLAEAILIALGLSSWWRCKTGRGVEWKGRRYRSGAEAPGR